MIRQLQNAGPTLKIILAGLLLLFCGSMVITLIPGFGSSMGLGSGSPTAGVLATVGDEKVTVLDVQREARQMIARQFPRGGAQVSMLLPYFTNQAAQELISEKALVAQAHQMGLRTSDEELREELQHGQLAETLFPDGKFVGQEEYENFIQRNNMTVPQFEALEKEYILIRKLQALVAGTTFVSDAEVHDEFQRRDTKVKFEYAVVTQADVLKDLHPTTEELKAFYDHNKATYNNSIPEKRQIKYAVVDVSKLGAATAVTDQELQTYYDQHRDEYRVPDQVKVRHILIKTPLPAPGAKEDEKAIAAARTKAEDVLKQVKAGGDFAKLAEKYSDDPGSAKSGGELGWIGRGRTVPEFEKAAFSLGKGQTSDLIKSSYGFHIINLEDKQDAHLKPLAEVKGDIEEKLKQQKVAHAAETAGNTLLSAARTDGIDKAAAAKGLPVVTTDFFTHNDTLPGLGPAPQLMDSVFNEPEKAQADVVQVPQGYVVYQLLGIKPPATPSFEEIRSRVETEFKNQRASFLLQQRTQELSDRAKSAHDLKKAAKELGATVKTSDLVAPDGQVPDIGALSGPASVIFTLKPGDISAPITAGGNGIVAQLLDKQVPSDQEFVQKKDQVRQSLLEAKQNQMFQLFVSNLRRDMEKSNRIKINQEEMKNLTHQNTEEGS
jgi:peptidyl-prolyl cis-trans isomerase D